MLAEQVDERKEGRSYRGPDILARSRLTIAAAGAEPDNHQEPDPSAPGA